MQKPIKNGFTMVELSIVIVVIGLIVGAVFVGTDLVRAAAVRATVAQMESFNSAINTFEAKYGALPGDMSPALASQNGFFTFTGTDAGTAGCGDNNGFIDSGATCTEVWAFWRHLSDAQLIKGAYGIGTLLDTTTGRTTVTLERSDVAKIIPPAKYSDRMYIGIQPTTTSRNSYSFTPLTSIAAGGGAVGGSSTPNELYDIDNKIDDGRPYMGNAQTIPTPPIGTKWGATPTLNKCVYGGATRFDLTEQYYNTTYGTIETCMGFLVYWK